MPYQAPEDLPDIVIASRDLASNLLRRSFVAFRHVISINDGDDHPPRVVQNRPGRNLILRFHDITHEDEDLVPPCGNDVAKIISFADGIQPQETVLVHCNAGISRSSAAALTVIASMLEPTKKNAERAVEELLRVKEAIRPNWLMVKFADEQLSYKGTLLGAYREAFGAGTNLLWLPVK